MDRIWIVGQTGQIGSALMRLLGESAISPSARELDLSQPVFGSRLPAWPSGLEECMEEWMASHK